MRCRRPWRETTLIQHPSLPRKGAPPRLLENLDEDAHLQYEKNPKIKEAIIAKFIGYLCRTEENRVVLDEAAADHLGLPTTAARPLSRDPRSRGRMAETAAGSQG